MAKGPVAGPLLSAIAAATRWLDQADVRAAVIGGVAASLVGRPRVTKDVDLLAVADESAWPELLAMGKAHGIGSRTDDAIEFARTTRVLLLSHEPSGVELDISFAGLQFERELVERATLRSVRSVTFRVATAEDLLIMKVLALRPRDIADIEGILTVVKRLDLDRVRRTIAEFSAALGSDDFVTEFERILKRVKTRPQG